MVSNSGQRRLVIALLLVVALGGLAWFVGRPLLYVMLDEYEPAVPPPAALTVELPPRSEVLASHVYCASGNLGRAVRLAVVQAPADTSSAVGDVLAAYQNSGWKRLGEQTVGSNEGCVSVTAADSYLSNPVEDETRKNWVREVVPKPTERQVVLTISRC
jgi:hypothetical protein